MPELDSAPVVSYAPKVIQLSFGTERANTYFLISDKHVIIIDACSQRVAEEVHSRELTPDYIILTHEHADHLWGLNVLRERYPQARVIAQKECSAAIVDPQANKAAQYRIYAILRYGKDYQNIEAENRRYRCKPADIEFESKYDLLWNGYNVMLVHTPGHSPGSSMVLLNEKMVFSGDTILNEDTFLKFQGGDEQSFSAVTLPLIHEIQPDALILPGHGKPFIKREWMKSAR